MRRPPPFYVNQRYITRMSTSMDSMDLIAWHEYGEPTDYWRIAEMNPAVVVPDDLKAGTMLHVPVVTVR